jgi:hypothetical protein
MASGPDAPRLGRFNELGSLVARVPHRRQDRVGRDQVIRTRLEPELHAHRISLGVQSFGDRVLGQDDGHPDEHPVVEPRHRLVRGRPNDDGCRNDRTGLAVGPDRRQAGEARGRPSHPLDGMRDLGPADLLPFIEEARQDHGAPLLAGLAAAMQGGVRLPAGVDQLVPDALILWSSRGCGPSGYPRPAGAGRASVE